MAIKPAQVLNNGSHEHRTRLKPTEVHGTDTEVPLSEPVIVSSEAAQEQPSSPDTIQDNALRTGPSLLEISRLLRLQKYQSRTCRQVQRQLYRVQTVRARSSRLIHTARSVHRTLAECIRGEDKHSFVNLYNSFHDAVNDCSDQIRDSLETIPTPHDTLDGYPASFLDTLPPDARSSVLEFLSNVKHDGVFVADRLAALTHREAVALLPEKGLSKSSDSIFGSSPRTSSRTSRHLGFVVDGQTELLSSSEYSSPLETLIHSVRGTFRHGLQDDNTATTVWATACARLIAEQKHGSEKLVPFVIDTWAFSSPWQGKDRLGSWILQTLQKGTFLLEQPSRQSFRARVQGRPEAAAEDETRLETFYAEAVNSLLTLLADTKEASVIPEGARRLCQAICLKLKSSARHQVAFPNFVMTRWLFTSFLPDAITLPEIHGLLVDHYVSDGARQRILREVVNRCQRAVFDVVYAWKHGYTATGETTQLVQRVATCFESSEDHHELFKGMAPVSPAGSDDESLVALSAADIKTLVDALHPLRRPMSFSSDRNSSLEGLQSSASSISGFSLFQNSGISDWDHGGVPVWPQEPTLAPYLASSKGLGSDAESFEPQDFAQSTFSADRLREACAGLDEVIASRRPSDPHQWCILVSNLESQTLCTMHEKLLESVRKGTSTSGLEQSFSDHGKEYKMCKDAIKDLLTSDTSLGPAILHESEALVDLRPAFLTLFEQRITHFERSSDFVQAHDWFCKLRSFCSLFPETADPKALLQFLDAIYNDKQRSMDRSLNLVACCDLWLHAVRPRLESQNGELFDGVSAAGRLRNKMWYTADVRTSAIYDELRSVAAALKVMGKPKTTAQTHPAVPSRHWSGARVPATGLQMKSEAQVLDLLSAPLAHGGPNKLGDDQSKAVCAWLERNSIEDICRGEERLHKVCMEIRKAVDQLTASNSTLMSSALFLREKVQATAPLRNSSESAFLTSQNRVGRLELLNLRTNLSSNTDAMSSTFSRPLSTRSSRELFESRSPTLTNRSSTTFWSPVMTEADSPSSATSIGSSQTQAIESVPSHIQAGIAQNDSQGRLEKLRQTTTSLLLSDLATPLFNEGSETDHAFWTGLGGELTEKHLRSLSMTFTLGSYNNETSGRFDFGTAFANLLHRFQTTSSPFIKLDCLHDIDTLLGHCPTERAVELRSSWSDMQPRATLQRTTRRTPPDVVEKKVDGFRRLFCDGSMRPLGVFRDLQYIAALVPNETLEKTSQGEAFWNAAKAMLGLQREFRQVMVETADSIIAYHSNNRGHGRSSSTAQQERDSATFSAPSRTPSAEDVARYSMADAGYFLQIAAKEGDPVAQRELATLYLTHPELMDHIIAPFSRPRDVFKEELESKWRRNQDPNRCDPVTMCVAHHWMSLSSKGGDALAKEYLRQREEMERLP